MRRERGQAATVLAVVAIVGGLAGAVNALGAPFAADRGEQLWRLYSMNTLGGVLTVVGGLAAAAGARRGSKGSVLLAGALFLVMAGLTVLGVGRTWNPFGGRASTASFWLMLGVGLTALVVSPSTAPDGLAGRQDA
jgi:hypothetical protein